MPKALSTIRSHFKKYGLKVVTKQYSDFRTLWIEDVNTKLNSSGVFFLDSPVHQEVLGRMNAARETLDPALVDRMLNEETDIGPKTAAMLLSVQGY